MNRRLFSIILLAFSLFPVSLRSAAAEDISLRNALGRAVVNPATMECRFQPTGRPMVGLSAAMPAPVTVANLKESDRKAEWSLPDLNLQVTLQLEQDALSVHFVTSKPGSFTWPRIVDPAIRAWTLPLNEGAFVPSDDAKWIKHLVERGSLDTTADLGLPFWGLRFDDFTISVVLPNPFNNELRFENVAGRLGASLTHQFTRTQKVKEYSVRFCVGGTSPVEAARHYREWLIARGEFVSLKEKIQRTPEVAKLPGAAHIYLWGEDTLTAEDITDWKGFAQQIKTQGESTASSPAKRLWSLLEPETKKLVSTIVNAAERPDRYTQSQVVKALNEALARVDFYDEAGWQGASLDAPTRELAKEGPAKLSHAQLCRFNSRLLFAAFPDRLTSPDTWGDGVSPKMIRQLADAGFDRLWLGSPSWEGLLKRPETVEFAKERGFLIAPYDDYNGIHRPGEADTWETSQFDAELYDRGAIVRANGKKMAGFQQKGYMLSPLVAQPYVEERVTRLMGAFHANSWFIDCDGFGQYYDDYSDVHPASQSDDVRARVKRMAWIRDRFGTVIGSEGCSAAVASTIHFAHGVMTPTMGWGDADMNNKQSPYYQGTYYPANEPAKFFKSIPLKENYHYYHFDPRFRLPLFEAVFHDSVVATHHWESGSYKFRDEVKTTQLLELLYGVPPLWHLNVAEFLRRGKEMKRYYDFFSPLHRETATLPLTSFEWLTPDRTVQRTLFGEWIEVVANLGSTEFRQQNRLLPGYSVVVRRLDSGAEKIFSFE
jgi:hypothetical protein